MPSTTPPRPPYGLLLISGSYTHQENYARAFAADERCRLIGLTDESDVSPRRRELNQRLADELGIPLLDDLDSALERDDVQIVSVCAEPERRARLAARCARAGKHVYVDKPVATNVQDAERLTVAVREAGVCSQAFSLVRSPVARRAREAIATGRVGELIGLHCDLMFAKGPGGTADLSRPRQEKAVAERFTFVDSKRELFCVGWYPLVLFEWLSASRVESVYASTSNYFFAEHQRNDVEDLACLLMHLDNGVQATLAVGRTGWQSHPGSGIHQIHVVGTDDSLTFDAFRPRLEIYSEAPAWTPPEIPHPEDPMGFWSSTQQESGVLPKTDWWPIDQAAARDDASYFLDCIERGQDSDLPASLAAHAVEVILAAYRSAADARVVSIAETQ